MNNIKAQYGQVQGQMYAAPEESWQSWPAETADHEELKQGPG